MTAQVRKLPTREERDAADWSRRGPVDADPGYGLETVRRGPCVAHRRVRGGGGATTPPAGPRSAVLGPSRECQRRESVRARRGPVDGLHEQLRRAPLGHPLPPDQAREHLAALDAALAKAGRLPIPEAS